MDILILRNYSFFMWNSNLTGVLCFIRLPYHKGEFLLLELPYLRSPELHQVQSPDGGTGVGTQEGRVNFHRQVLGNFWGFKLPSGSRKVMLRYQVKGGGLQEWHSSSWDLTHPFKSIPIYPDTSRTAAIYIRDMWSLRCSSVVSGQAMYYLVKS